MAKKLPSSRLRLVLVLLLSSVVSIGFFVGRVLAVGDYNYWFMTWNLFLAWLPLLFAWWLVVRLGHSRWISPGNLVITALWLGFLPNAFYIASDIVHLESQAQISLLYDVVMLVSFTFSGFILGYLSLFAVHMQLKKRLGRWPAHWLVAGTILLCSFAIYLGHYLRWNSWDVLINPAGLLFDVSEPFISPGAHPQVFTTTAMFFVLLSSFYVAIYQLVKIAKAGSSDL